MRTKWRLRQLAKECWTITAIDTGVMIGPFDTPGLACAHIRRGDAAETEAIVLGATPLRPRLRHLTYREKP